MAATITRNGVCYDLKNTPYVLEIEYGGAPVKYSFSSELYRGKFQERIKSNREKINSSLTNRFGMPIEFNMLADVNLYATVEKRGFCVRVNDEVMTCLEKMRLGGENLTTRN